MNIRNPQIDNSQIIPSGEIRVTQDDNLLSSIYISNPSYIAAFNNEYTQQIYINDNAHFVFEPDYELSGAELKIILQENIKLKEDYNNIKNELDNLKKIMLKLDTQLNGSIQQKIIQQKHKI